MKNKSSNNTLIIIINCIKRSKLLFLVLIFSIVISIAAELIPSFLLKKIIDNNLKTKILSGINLIALLYLGSIVLNSITGFLKVFTSSCIGQDILIGLRISMAKHLTGLPLGFFNKTAVGDIMSRYTSDIDAINILFSESLINVFTDMFKLTGIIVAIYILSPGTSVIIILAVPVIYVISDFFRKNMFKYQYEVRKKIGMINVYIQEIFNGVKTIKAFNKEEKFVNDFRKPLTEHLDVSNKTAFFDALFPCILQAARAIVIVLVVFTASRTGLHISLGLTIGTIAALADLTGRFFSPIDSLSQSYQTIQQAFAGLKRVEELFTEKKENRGIIQEFDHIDIMNGKKINVKIKDVSFGYTDDRMILKNINIDIKHGTKAAIIGLTGSGKTTLMNLIAGLYQIEKGELSIGGINPHSLDPSDRRKMLGIVPQNVHVFEGTVLENITLFDRSIDMADVIEASKNAGLHDFIDNLLDKYNTFLGETGYKFSQGQYQLLSLARALIKDPPVLLLDEPTSGIDALTEDLIFKTLKKICINRTIITISHRLSGILDADSIYILSNGEIVQSGTPQELSRSKGWYNIFKQLEELKWKVEV